MTTEELKKLYAKMIAQKRWVTIFLILNILFSVVIVFLSFYLVVKVNYYFNLLANLPGFTWILFGCYAKKVTRISDYNKCLVASIKTALGSVHTFNDWDAFVQLKSKIAVDKYTDIDYFKNNEEAFKKALSLIDAKQENTSKIKTFLKNNLFMQLPEYEKSVAPLKSHLQTPVYVIFVAYISPAGRSQYSKLLQISKKRLLYLKENPQVFMSKTEWNKYVKDQEKQNLELKKKAVFDSVNETIDLVNKNKDSLPIKGDKEALDQKISDLIEKTLIYTKKIKTADSEDWSLLNSFMSDKQNQIYKIIDQNLSLISYYDSPDFLSVQQACKDLMDNQREFNEYVQSKADNIAQQFGKLAARTETIFEDEFNYIHPYQKTVAPFTAEVSDAVFASAENNPLDYVIKIFYPDKTKYPEQIQKLQSLIGELETLKEAKDILEVKKSELQEYLTNVPSFVLDLDSDGFYKRLGFAVLDEATLTVEYMFSYTSNAGKSKRSFSVPMTEDTIIKLIEKLESKLTMSAFTKEQRALMTSKLRRHIKERDDYTCKICSNSIYKEPNLLLEVDHIIPVGKGGYTEESNLQTLCWKCNRKKGVKLLTEENLVKGISL